MSKYYSKEEKMRAIELYRSGLGSVSVGRKIGVHSSSVLRWYKIYVVHGEDGLGSRNRVVNSARKRKAVRMVLENFVSCERAALEIGVGRTSVCRWTEQVRDGGYAALSKPRRAHSKTMPMGRRKKKTPETELEKLREENLMLRAENALLKKVKALVEKREAQHRVTGRKPSSN